MMDYSHWLAFTLAATVILAIPGPTIILVLVQSLTHGPRATLPLVAGVALGDLIAVSASLLGLGVILATSAMLFTFLKWLGAVYLCYLGWKLWCEPPQLDQDIRNPRENVPRGRLFRHACLVTAFNPKGIIFFMAFVPQFVQPEVPVNPQFLLMAVTFLILAVANATLYALFARRIRAWLIQPAARRWFQRGGASALVGAGLLTAMTERS